MSGVSGGGSRQKYIKRQERSRSPRRKPAASSSSGILGRSDAGEGLRRYVAQMHLSGKMSALEFQQLSTHTTSAGAEGLEDIAQCGKSGELPGNIQRDVMRQLLKETSAPAPYFAQIPTHNPKTGQNRVMVWLPFLLVHEMLAGMCRKSSSTIDRLSSLGEKMGRVMEDTCRKANMCTKGLVALGFHGDGVPHQKNRSAQVFSWNCLALAYSERMLFCVIAKEFCCKCGCLGRCTLDAIADVFAWSMQLLATGEWPTCRHDGSPWCETDKTRAKWVGSMGVRAILLQCRGDWSWMKELLGFPSWSSNEMCWLCEANKSNFTDFGLSAPWRRQRRTPEGFFARQRAMGVPRSPLFRCPGFSLLMVVIDMLHACDLGVSQIAVGNLFMELLPTFGPNRATQVRNLWASIKTYYTRAQSASKIQTLAEEMIVRPGKGPRLRTKGAETRGLIAYAAELARQHHQETNTTRSHTLMRVFALLLDVYQFVASSKYNAEAAATACRQFLVLYSSLAPEDAESKRWRVKPKFHMMQELFEFQANEMGSSPAEFWCYRDEDFVGWVATFAGSKGGANNAASAGLRTIQRYRARVRDL